MKKLLSAIVMAVLAIGCITAQTSERTVRGYVIDKNGNPIPGAEVSATGGAETTITDSDGSFSLQVPPFLKSLIATYTGMGTKKMKIPTSGDMIFEMKEKWPSKWFLNVVGSFGFTDDGYCYGYGGGIMVGVLSKWGYYFKGNLDSEMCPNITIGVVKGITGSIYGYLGVGYGRIKHTWDEYSFDEYGSPLEVISCSDFYDGMAIDAGVIIKTSKHFNITAGYTMTTELVEYPYIRHTLNVGVGYVF